MTGINISHIVSVPPEEVRRAYWSGFAWKRLTQAIAHDMGDQARANLIKLGGPGGAWPRLKGYKHPSSPGTVKRLRKQSNAIARRIKGSFNAAGAAEVHRLRSRAKVLSHSGYARLKAEGKTPGHGKFGADVVGRDTGALAASLDGVVDSVNSGAVRVRLIARGGVKGRPDNQTLLGYLVNGTNKMPPRPLMDDTSLFRSRASERIRLFLAQATKL